MSTVNTTRSEPSIPSEQEAQVARQASRVLASWIRRDGNIGLHVHVEGDAKAEIDLTPCAARVLLGALEEIGRGNSVTVIPNDAELTTQQAADLAHVSRPFFIKLLQEVKVPFRMVGAHRRVRFQDVACYIQEEEARRVKVMEELVAVTERLGLYE